MVKNIFFFLTLILFCLPSYAEQVITLQDGSQVKGELTGIRDGVYTIRTQTMGDVNVNSSQVGAISNPEAMPTAEVAPPPSDTPNPDITNQIQAAQTRVMADPQIMGDIQALVQDPEIAQLITDPSILQAVTSKDVNALQNNPKARTLIQNPKMQAIMEKIRQGQNN